MVHLALPNSHINTGMQRSPPSMWLLDSLRTLARTLLFPPPPVTARGKSSGSHRGLVGPRDFCTGLEAHVPLNVLGIIHIKP